MQSTWTIPIIHFDQTHYCIGLIICNFLKNSMNHTTHSSTDRYSLEHKGLWNQNHSLNSRTSKQLRFVFSSLFFSNVDLIRSTFVWQSRLERGKVFEFDENTSETWVKFANVTRYKKSICRYWRNVINLYPVTVTWEDASAILQRDKADNKHANFEKGYFRNFFRIKCWQTIGWKWHPVQNYKSKSQVHNFNHLWFLLIELLCKCTRHHLMLMSFRINLIPFH